MHAFTVGFGQHVQRLSHLQTVVLALQTHLAPTVQIAV